MFTNAYRRNVTSAVAATHRRRKETEKRFLFAYFRQLSKQRTVRCTKLDVYFRHPERDRRAALTLQTAPQRINEFEPLLLRCINIHTYISDFLSSFYYTTMPLNLNVSSLRIA